MKNSSLYNDNLATLQSQNSVLLAKGIFFWVTFKPDEAKDVNRPTQMLLSVTITILSLK